MQTNFPNYALECIRGIEAAGFEAWFVGGCVRDMLIGRPFHDIDVATNAPPDAVQAIFPHTIPTGIKHGTVTVIIDKNSIEVTTYRTESGYEDNRHPERVAFLSDITGDLSRRDFTINAMAYHPGRGLLDLFDGENDLKRRVIRCVGQPDTRFKEDALRILRAYRFACVLDFTIEPNTLNAARNCAARIERVSGERILEELKKLVCGQNPAVFDHPVTDGLLTFCGIRARKLPKSLALLKGLPDDPAIRFPAFVSMTDHDLIKLKEALKPDNHLYSDIKNLDTLLAGNPPDSKAALKRLWRDYGLRMTELYVSVLSLFGQPDIKTRASAWANEILDRQEPYRIDQLDIDGKSLTAVGLQGETVGLALRFLNDHVIENPSDNQRERLLEHLKNFHHE